MFPIVVGGSSQIRTETLTNYEFVVLTIKLKTRYWSGVEESNPYSGGRSTMSYPLNERQWLYFMFLSANSTLCRSFLKI